MSKKFFNIFIFLVIFKALSYWIISWWEHPNDPLSTIVMYRIGDVQFYPLISALSDLNLGEFSLFEFKGYGLSSFPFASILIHSILYRFLGLYGYIAADILVALLYYWALTRLLKLIGVTEFLASLTSVLIVTGTVDFVLSGVSNLILILMGKNHPLNDMIWGWRIPRPFVSDIFLLCCLYYIFKLLHLSRSVSDRKCWLFLGICLAALLQGDIYSAINIFIAIFCMLLFFVVKEKGLNIDLIKKTSLFLISFIIFSMPFFVQLFLENHDVSRRLGLFPIARNKFYFIGGESIYASLFLIFTLFTIVILVTDKYFPYFAKRDLFKRNSVILFGICLTSYLAQPISIIVLGKGIQLNHFGQEFVKISLLISLVYLLYLIILFRESALKTGFLKKISHHGPIIKIVVVCVILIMFSVTVYQSHELSVNKLPMPIMYSPNRIYDYRKNFVALIKELDKAQYKKQKVIGTFDPQVYTWWVSFKNGYSYLPDPITTLPDSMIEERFLRFCKIVGMPQKVFEDFINPFLVDRLLRLKYQASAIYTFKPLSDYDPREQQIIIHNSPLSNPWLQIMPKSERERLVGRYASQDLLNPYRLDMIIMTKDVSFELHGPDLNRFVLSYENDYFKVLVIKT